MTHEELLEKVNIRAAWEEKRSDGTTVLVIDYDDAPNTKALRAVVELITKENTIPLDDYHFGYMAACKAVYEAIEKELK